MEENKKKFLLPPPPKKLIPLPNKKPILLPTSPLNKIIKEKEINDWVKNHPGEYVIQPKIDEIPTSPSKKLILLPNKQQILPPRSPTKQPILLPRSPTKQPILLPKSPTLLSKSPTKSLLPRSPTRSPVKQTINFSPDEIDEDTVIDLAMSLDRDNFKGLIDFLSEYYYNDESLVTDKTFNQLENIYKELYGEYEAEWPLPRGQTVILPYHLSSLKKMIEEKDINNWIKNHSGPYLLQDKIDGITLLLVSEMVNNKRKISLFTHGDGVEGKDISHVLEYLTLPKIDYDIAIRAEGVYTLDVFEQFKNDRPSHKKPYKNPRNMITGTLTSKESFNPKIVKHLSFYAYQIRSERNTPLDDIIKLQELGFDVPFYKLENDISKDFLEEYYLERKAVAKTEIDGTVVYQNVVIDYPEIKGKLPSQVIAFKTDTGAEIGETTVTHITWKASKHRKLKPKVHYDNVAFKAADLKRATGHNARFIVDNNIGVGAIIRVKRSGDVIPYIINVVKPAPEGPDLPDVDVHGLYEWNENGVEFILLEDNDEVRANKLKHFLVTLKVKKAGPKRIESIVESGVKTIKDLINSTPEQLSKLSGIGINLATQILDDIKDKITDVPLARILDASDIFPGIGERRFDEIIEVHPDLLNYAYDNPNKIIEMIRQIRGFGPKLSEIIGHNLSAFVNWLYDNPAITIEKQEVVVNKRGNQLAGESVVFSGFRDPDLMREVKLAGGKVPSTVSKNTTILVLKDLEPETFKGKGKDALIINEKSNQLGKGDIIRIMSKEDFLNEYF
jgi:NAD-dependent DNA ligase